MYVSPWPKKMKFFIHILKKRKMVDLAVFDSASNHADNSAQASSIYCQ